MNFYRSIKKNHQHLQIAGYIISHYCDKLNARCRFSILYFKIFFLHFTFFFVIFFVSFIYRDVMSRCSASPKINNMLVSFEQCFFSQKCNRIIDYINAQSLKILKVYFSNELNLLLIFLNRQYNHKTSL